MRFPSCGLADVGLGPKDSKDEGGGELFDVTAGVGSSCMILKATRIWKGHRISAYLLYPESRSPRKEH